MKLGEYRALASQVDSAATDFLFLNGDIVSAGNYVADTLILPLSTILSVKVRSLSWFWMGNDQSVGLVGISC